jgi:hypothetical protein
MSEKNHFKGKLRFKPFGSKELRIMKKMVSKVNSIPANTTRDIRRLKGQQDNTTERLSGDTTGVLGSGDPDQIQFLTAPFKDLRMMQIGESKGAFGSLALMPDQHASLETPFYSTGTPFPLDRAGTGVFGYNIARTGQPPTGYYGGDKVMIQLRYKIYYNGEDGDPANPFFIYKIDLEANQKATNCSRAKSWTVAFWKVCGLTAGPSRPMMRATGLETWVTGPGKPRAWCLTTKPGR